jgi:hypothetical protein
VPFFMKQWGEWGPAPFIVRVCDPDVGWQGTEEELAAAKADSEARGATHVHTGNWLRRGRRTEVLASRDRAQAVVARAGAASRTARRHPPLGQGRAGRELDGRTWDQFPQGVKA